MSANIRVGGARVDFSANAGGYLSTLRRIEAANRGLLTSYSGIGRQAQRQTQFIDQFTASMRSSLIATAAYAVGVNAVRLALGGSIGGFRDLDAGLIRIAKTTNLADDQLGRLRVSLTAINTESSRLGPPLNIAREQLLRIGEVVGQLGVRGVPAITQFTRAAAALDISSDLFGEEAARALGRFIASTGTAQNEVDGVASAVTALGNIVAGGERELLQYSTRLARDVAGSGRLANDVLIALAASFVNVGAAPEAAATTIGRTLDAINQLAGDENLQRFRVLGEVAGRHPGGSRPHQLVLPRRRPECGGLWRLAQHRGAGARQLAAGRRSGRIDPGRTARAHLRQYQRQDPVEPRCPERRH